MMKGGKGMTGVAGVKGGFGAAGGKAGRGFAGSGGDPWTQMMAMMMGKGSMQHFGQPGGKQDSMRGDPSLMVTVSGLPLGTQWPQLKDHMKYAGPVAFCNVNGSTGQVRYETHAEVQNAIGMLNGTEFGGHQISVAGGIAMDGGFDNGNGFGGSGGDDWNKMAAMMMGNNPKQGFSEPGVNGDDMRGDPSLMVNVSGLPPRTTWQMLKDHMGHAGTVGFCNARGSSGQVRYGTPAEAQNAVAMLNGSDFAGHQISVEGVITAMGGGFGNVQSFGGNGGGMMTRGGLTQGFGNSGGNGDNVRGDPSQMVNVSGLPLGTGWQELKDHMRQAGSVAFCNARGSSGQVKYGTPMEAQNAIAMLNGSELGGHQISVCAAI